MDTTAELLEAINSEGWRIVSTAPGHASACHGCLYAALNGLSLAGTNQTTTGRTDNGHWATITQKGTR